MTEEIQKHWVKIGFVKLGEGLCELFAWDPETKQLMRTLEDELEDEDPIWQVFTEASSKEEATKKYHAYCDGLVRQTMAY